MDRVDDSELKDKTPSESGAPVELEQAPVWRGLIRDGKYDDAIKEIEQHLERVPDDVGVLEDMGVVFARQRKFEKAAEIFRNVVRIAPRKTGAWRNLARACVDLGQLQDAETAMLKVCELEASSAGNYRALADLLTRMKRDPDAVKAMEKAVALEPQSAELHHQLGKALSDVKKYSDARHAFLKAIELNPDSSEVYNDLGVACQELGEGEDAVKHLKEAVRLRPGVIGAYNNLGVALNEQRRFDEAIECYNKALAIGPDYALAWNNLGNSLRAVGRNEAAVAALQTAIRLKPDYPEAFNNLAIAYVQMGENEKALEWYDKALCFRPDYPECHMNRALQRLLLGDFSNGWADYEWRWQLKSMRHRDFKKPLWDGSPLGGKKILIYWEQGLGDSIQFIRYAKELKDRGATVIFEGQPPLQHLLTRTPGLDQFVPRGSELPPFDVHAPLLSLPGQCHTTLENVPSEIPYVLPDLHFVNVWKPRLEALKGLRVGIAWQGNPDHRGDQIRSISLRLFEPLARIQGVTLVSLQRHHGCEQLDQLGGSFEVVCFEGVDEEMDGFLRTAAIIKNLDLVITADTAVAHLAGAMGVPVWIAIAVACDWRWLRQREDSPWYPTARLFRQRDPGDWKEVFGRMTAALKQRVASAPRNKSQITPDDRKTARNLVRRAAKALTGSGPAKAQEQLEQAIAADPQCTDAHHDLGVVYGKQGRVGQAIACFRRALELQPQSSGAYGNIGLAFLQNGQIDEAIAHLRKAVRLGGGSADLYNNLGVAFMSIPDAVAAEQSYVKALHLRPDFAGAHCNLGRSLLVQGKFEQGWLELEWRWNVAPQSKRDFRQPRWTGQSLDGRTILIWAETTASAGEIIQFVRYAKVVKQMGARVVVEAPQQLTKLLSTCEAIDDVICTGSTLPKFDVHAALLSMPAIARTTLQTIPTSEPYLHADSSRAAKWKDRIANIEGLKVGIAWDGDPDSDLSSEGKIPLGPLRRLGQLGGVKLISMQKGRLSEQMKKLTGCMSMEDLGLDLDHDPCGAYSDVAAVMENVDLIVCSDNAVAHLAGALGVPVWLVLPHSGANFRWLLDRQDSPWYPTMKLFRQRRTGDWSELFERIADELLEMVVRSLPATDSAAIADASARTYYQEGCRCFARGEMSAATDRFQQAIRIKPDWAGAHHDLAVALAKQRKFNAAVQHFRRALEIEPTSSTCGNLALALLEKGDYNAAPQEIHQLLKVAPDAANINCRMGIALCRTGHHVDAERYLQKAIRLQQRSPEAHFWLGESYRHQCRFSLAIQSLRQALELRPDWHEAYNSLGLCFTAQGLQEDAIEAFRQTVRLNREFATAWTGLGIALADTNQLNEASEAFQHSIYLRPDDAKAHQNLANVLLLQGKYEQGWLEYEWRLHAHESRRRNLPGQRWDGSSLKGKRLLMLAERDLSDTIQFVRYARVAKAQGATTIVECQKPLVELLSRCAFIDQVIPVGDLLPTVDFHAALMSLPLGFGTTVQSIPSDFPYLIPDSDLCNRWKTEFTNEHRTRIGIVWQVNSNDGEDSHSSLPLAEFAPLSRIDGVELVSLQQDPDAKQLASLSFPLRLLEPLSPTIDDTAAIVSNLDAIVTCDTAAAHLARALGRAVLLAIPTTNHWRWMRGRADSPWYPTVRLFRQQNLGKWKPVISAIAEALGAKNQ